MLAAVAQLHEFGDHLDAATRAQHAAPALGALGEGGGAVAVQQASDLGQMVTRIP